MSEDARISDRTERFLEESKGLSSTPPFSMVNNDAVMTRFGFKICASCNVDLPRDMFEPLSDKCLWCERGHE